MIAAAVSPSEGGAAVRLFQPADAAAEPSPLCPHCKRRKAQTDRRGLCGACHDDEQIKNLYAVSERGNRCPYPDFPAGLDRPQPRNSTFWRPGTDEKVDMLAYRAALWLALHHEYDDRIEPDNATAERARRLFAAQFKLLEEREEAEKQKRFFDRMLRHAEEAACA